MNVYFDNAATTMVRGEVIDAMLLAMREDYGNPASTHYMGRRASVALETARANVAAALGAYPENVCFTSGGTESNNWAILSTAGAFVRKRGHIITSAIEHDAVMEPIKRLEYGGCSVTYLMPDKAGRITADSFSSALREDTVFASIMLVNNETGALNPLGEYSREIKHRKLRTVLHTDAVQGFCKVPLSVRKLGADLISISAHKIHGPKGIGALYIKENIKLPSVVIGGGQEKGRRAGTEALPAIVGFGVAASLGSNELPETSQAVRDIREYTCARLRAEIPGLVIIGDGDSPFLLCISLPGHKSEVLMSYLDGEGICVSKGAACKKGARSRVLEAMRLKNKVIDGALRLSFSCYSTQEEAEFFIQTLKHASEKLFKSL